MTTQPGIMIFRLVVLLAVMCAPSYAQRQPRSQTKPKVQIKIGENTTVVFATVEEGRKILSSRDDFVQRMSPFDRAARMKTAKTVSVKKYLAFVGKNVLAWNEPEKQKMTSAFQGIKKKLDALSVPFPKKIFFVKTTGKEEGAAEYTRANAIVFPKAHLKAPLAKIQHTICHELFHIMSRENPELREKLYAAIGFEKCNEIAFPLKFKQRKLTNPDAPRNDHYIRLQVKGKEQWAIPIIFSRSEKYDVKKGGEFFDYLQFKLLLVERDGDGSSTVRPIHDGRSKKPKLVDLQQVYGFFEQVGNNTGYIIHPEEILADNFSFLVMQKRDIPSPEIIEKMKKLFKK